MKNNPCRVSTLTKHRVEKSRIVSLLQLCPDNNLILRNFDNQLRKAMHGLRLDFHNSCRDNVYALYETAYLSVSLRIFAALLGKLVNLISSCPSFYPSANLNVEEMLKKMSDSSKQTFERIKWYLYIYIKIKETTRDAFVISINNFPSFSQVRFRFRIFGWRFPLFKERESASLNSKGVLPPRFGWKREKKVDGNEDLQGRRVYEKKTRRAQRMTHGRPA